MSSASIWARMRSMASAASAKDCSMRSTTNSSPPYRKSASAERRFDRIPSATRRSASSPATWPNVSLYDLKKSRSQMASEQRWP
jgi:hypothetical protein